MRTTLKAIGTAAATLAGLAGTAVLSGPALAHPTSAVETHTEKGIVLECTGEAGGLVGVRQPLRERRRSPTTCRSSSTTTRSSRASREPKNIWSDGVVRSSVTIKGKKATIVGSASKIGRRTRVHEEIDDAGNHVVSDGWHRRLENDLGRSPTPARRSS